MLSNNHHYYLHVIVSPTIVEKAEVALKLSLFTALTRFVGKTAMNGWNTINVTASKPQTRQSIHSLRIFYPVLTSLGSDIFPR